MPCRVISQPLPIDIRNWSFRGLNCEGWDFEGRDIRGCDFRNAKLAGAKFDKVTGGRSQRQITIDIALALALVLAFAFTFVGAIAVAIAVAGAVAGAGAFTGAFAFAGAVAAAAAIAAAGAGLSAIQAFSTGQITVGVVLSAVAIVCFIFAIYSGRGTVREFKKATGTNFKDANLKRATFSHATLNNCDFDNAETAYVDWSHVEGTQSSINFTNIRMQLLISRKGNSSMYSNLDLSDRYLTGIELIKANLSGADLTRSNLQKVDLTLANLTNAKAGDTDFRHATLTGACIQNWTINSGTQFDGLVCEHIFLTPDRDLQNRRPLSGSFEPGDFEILVDKFADTLDFILRRSTDPIAFKQALKQFQQDNPAARIKAMVDLDADRVLVQATVPESVDKVKIYEGFQVTLQLKEQEIRHLNKTLDEKDKHISMMDRWFHSLQRPMQVVPVHSG
jgi:uncharacterized protein YjbI with pentapeptide repeats